jgi:hypothetical protein
MRIDSSGRVGIGTTSASANLHVTAASDGADAIRADANSGNGLMILRPDGGNGNQIRFGGNGANANVLRFVSGGDTERARIDSSGRLLVGTSTSRVIGNVGGFGSSIQVESTTYATLSITQNSNDSTGSILAIGKSRGGIGSATIVQNGDTVGDIRFAAADGTNLLGQCAGITASIDGTPGANDMPGRLVFSTTADGASSPTERVRIANNGNFYIGGGTSFGASGWTTQNSGCQVNQYSPTNDTRNLYVWSSDNAGTNTAAVYIESTGKIYARTTTVQAIASERRLKENIELVDQNQSWSTIRDLPYYSYNFIGSDPANVVYGPIADEVPDEMRVATSQSDDVGVIHTYDNAMLQARSFVALQAALKRIEALEAEVAALKGA